ncbi:MAG: hypothetical protein GY820_25130 [Gammaproteobacteria bacterium]|nr:hypothetical protein [Gammaproteobacteria bacterium]
MDTNISRVYRSFQSIYRSKLFYIAFSGLILATNSWASIPGAIPGNFSVDAMGAATYQIPIEVPPGINGMQPELSLVYNSRGGNGLLGKGWGLGGLSSIGRCPKTLAQDGEIHGVDFSDNDRLCLDGQRLVLVNGNNAVDSEYWTLTAEYRTEIESFSKITRLGNGFKVETKSGRTMEYGTTADSEIEASGKTDVITWAFNKGTTTSGNYLTISYNDDKSNGEYYPNRIDYAGDNNSIRFTYEPLTDIYTTFQGGSVFNTTQRLQKIQAYAGLALVREYRLGYDKNGTANRSRLINLQECGSYGECLQASDFGWSLGGSTYDPVKSSASASSFHGGNWHWTTGDVDGDGLMDMVYHFKHKSVNVPSHIRVRLSNGDGTYGPVKSSASASSFHGGNWRWTTGDVDGDGLMDMVYHFKHSSVNVPSHIRVRLSNGDGTYGPVKSSASASSFYGGNWHWATGDVDGDGRMDMVYHFKHNSVNVPSHIRVRTSSLGGSDHLTTINDGLAATTNITYEPLTRDSIYTKDTVSKSEYPYRDIQNASYVISIVTTDNGLGGTNKTTYNYEGLKVNLHGRGSLGFQKMTVTDETSNITTTTTRSQSFPTTGMPTTTEQKYDGTLLLSRQTSTPANFETHTDVFFPYLSQTITENYDPNGSGLVSTETANSSYDSYGNPYSTTASTVGPGLSGASETFTTVTKNTYPDTFAALWPPTRLTRSEVTKYLPQYASTRDGSCIDDDCATRTSAFAYDLTTGQMTQEVIEPDLPAFRLQTDHGYDGFGNRTSSTVSGGLGGTAIASRTTSTVYDANGQFPISTKNALNHEETRTWDARFGVATSLTGPNGITTGWEYDSFGRKQLEIRADGTTTSTAREWCNGFNGEAGNPNCPAGGAWVVAQQKTGRPVASIYYDKLGRTIREETQGFDGTPIYADTVYNVKGQVHKKSRPYFGGGVTYWHTYTYDIAGRPLTETSPDYSVSTSSYSALATTVTNSKLQSTTQTKNVIGELRQVVDNEGNSNTYRYDALGNLTTTADTLGNSITTSYDIHGNKTIMDDPDMGLWTYGYNALGELIRQTDAKGSSITTSYDKLGRKTQRTEAEGVSSWTYDTANKGVGKPASSTGAEGIQKSASYDSLGRPYSSATTIAGVTYTIKRTYNSSGKLDTLQYPASTHNPLGLIVKHEYNARGYLLSVKNADTQNTYWQADSRDATGNLTSATYGNGVVTDNIYNDQTGFLENIITYSGNDTIQDLTYSFDAIGNLELRNDYLRGVHESFSYDGLNRLTGGSVGGNTVLHKAYSYDAIGNIKTKTNIGSYLYGAGNAGPHAVTSVNNNGLTYNFSYDLNGNMTSGHNLSTGAARTLSWTSYNKPSSIQQPGNSASFFYGENRARFKQVSVANNETTTRIYIGSLFEKEVKGNTVTDQHYIRAGGQTVAIYKSIFDSSNSHEKTRYLHRDHIGSISEITNEGGIVTESMSFDAFGKRRNTDWSDAAIPIEGGETKRSYTGHEYLDNVGIIHMNGRVYDPDLGRFMSADPFIKFVDSTQGFNRYSYTDNNPLSRVDPGGFGWFKKLLGSIHKGIRKVKDNISGFIDKYKTELKQLVVIVASYYVGTWAYDAYMSGATAGAASADAYIAAHTAGQATAGTIAAAASGATMGLGNGYNSGLRGSDLFKAGLTGAALGSMNTFDAGQTLFHHYANLKAREMVSRFAESNGMSSTEFNLALTGLSFIGNNIKGIGSRLEIRGSTALIKGISSRGGFGYFFDGVDLVLSYQGLPTASAYEYIFSGHTGNLTGYSAGSIDVSNIAGLGLANGSVNVVSLPFLNIAPGSTSITLGAFDPVNGGALGWVFNPTSNLEPLGLGDHINRRYPQLPF